VKTLGGGCTGCTGATEEEEVATGNEETGNRKETGWSEPLGYKCWQDNTRKKLFLITDGPDCG